jgi:hypothetical protein
MENLKTNIMSEMMINEKWNDLPKKALYNKLRTWRENLEKATQDCVSEYYKGDCKLSEFKKTYIMMKEETNFLVQYSRINKFALPYNPKEHCFFDSFLIHLRYFNNWMDLVFGDCDVTQISYREWRLSAEGRASIKCN